MYHNIALSDDLLLEFRRHTQDLYGEIIITPNMDVYRKMREVLKEHEPEWFISYEQLSGILGNQTTTKQYRHIQSICFKG